MGLQSHFIKLSLAAVAMYVLSIPMGWIGNYVASAFYPANSGYESLPAMIVVYAIELSFLGYVLIVLTKKILQVEWKNALLICLVSVVALQVLYGYLVSPLLVMGGSQDWSKATYEGMVIKGLLFVITFNLSAWFFTRTKASVQNTLPTKPN